MANQKKLFRLTASSEMEENNLGLRMPAEAISLSLSLSPTAIPMELTISSVASLNPIFLTRRILVLPQF